MPEKRSPDGLLITLELICFIDMQQAVDLGHEETVMELLNQTLADVMHYFD